MATRRKRKWRRAPCIRCKRVRTVYVAGQCQRCYHAVTGKSDASWNYGAAGDLAQLARAWDALVRGD